MPTAQDLEKAQDLDILIIVQNLEDLETAQDLED